MKRRRIPDDEPTLFDLLAEAGKANVLALGRGRAESPAASGPMEARDLVHDRFVANTATCILLAQGQASVTAPNSDVGTVREDCRERICPEVGQSVPRDVGEVGVGACSDQAAEWAEDNALNMRFLRPVDLVRLINSTSLGTVIGKRHFYRHRMRAGAHIANGRRIDLYRYAAWLIGVRNEKREARQVALSGVISVPAVTALLERQSYRCALTGRNLVPASAALDHIIPVSRGGEHRMDNAQVLEVEVNRAKGALTNQEFVQLCREVSRWMDGKAIREGRAIK